jgi:uncharacterized protein YkwD
MRAKGLIASLSAAIVLAASLAAPGAAVTGSTGSTCVGVDALPESTTTALLGESVRCLLNQRRLSAGLKPLGPQPKLLRAAGSHGKDMIRHQFVSHLGSNGSTPLSRVRRTGFLNGAGNFAVGEDLAWGESSLVIPVNVVTAWMDSSIHRRNILDKRFTRVGVGVLRGDPTIKGNPGDALTYVVVFGVARH